MTKRLDELAAIRTGLVLSRFKAPECGSEAFEYRVITMGCFGDSSKVEAKGLESFLSKRKIDRKYLTVRGDILVRLRAPLHAVYAEEDGLLFSSITIVIRPNDAAISSKYLLHYLNSVYAQKQLFREIKGTRIPTIKTSDFAALEIVVPPREEQERVIAFLEAAEREARLMEELKQARAELAGAILNQSIKKYEE